MGLSSTGFRIAGGLWPGSLAQLALTLRSM